MTTELLMDEARAVELIGILAGINEQIAPLEKQKKAITEQLKQYMALAGLDSLHDGETGVTARMQDRRGTPTYDLVSAVKNGDDGALIEAAAAGMVRLDHTMLARFRKDSGAGWADNLAKYEMPGTGTTALVIEAAK